ncbi:MAG: hypothetical protein A2622_01565 [Bdellovibrionales bacterium RIFCSPHIGHO2_01_FULL_40_29]|nr:MAG: hypothetical protein A2622_01565 [Bdellovibrionales bacterium RIFCSPHIGHO2_01_FULL_40_29]OFZ33783.1 MAG: hypothetical protein A3D17_01985 [Bdellovibrionales bacterium RIFCSPHIGHO2_02_FULL_40_15]
MNFKKKDSEFSLKNKLMNWLIPTFLLVGLVVFTSTSFFLFERNDSYYRYKKSEQVANAIVLNLKNEINNHIAVLKIVGKEQADFKKVSFDALASSLIKEFPGMFAVNLIDSEGTIKKVFPYESNKLALGKNLLDRVDIRDYLIDSKSDGEPRMSHKLMTYQKVAGYTLYIPLHSFSGQFQGWLNAVVDFDSWIIEYLDVNNLLDARVLIRWDHPNSQIIERGSKNLVYNFKYSYEILNQRLEIEIGFAPSDLELIKRKYFLLIIGLGCALLLVSLLLAIKLNLARMKYVNISRNMILKNNLLSSLTYDISSPIYTLRMSLQAAIQNNQPLSAINQERATKSLKTIDEMLKSAKMLHAEEMGFNRIKNQSVSLVKVIQDSITIVNDQAQAKKVKFNIESDLRGINVLAEPITLIHNVMANVLANAIKFSPVGEVVEIYIRDSSATVQLYIEDHGGGIGTLGEYGTGLGLIQIRSFMEIYGGSFELKNTDLGGCQVILNFNKV